MAWLLLVASATSLGCGGETTPDEGRRSVADTGPRVDAVSACPDPQPETCNGLDDDCDGSIDEDAVDAPDLYRDQDGDGYGAGASLLRGCVAAEGLADNDDDCDDDNRFRYPGAQEVCNDIDDDCNGAPDDGNIGFLYADVDGDGLGDPSCFVDACFFVEGFVPTVGDCDDDDPAVGLGDCEQPEGQRASVLFIDSDGDGYGAGEAPQYGCRAVDGFVSNARDCNDLDPLVNPAMLDLCDGEDQDCDGEDACGPVEGFEVVDDVAERVVTGGGEERVGRRIDVIQQPSLLAVIPVWSQEGCSSYRLDVDGGSLRGSIDACAPSSAPAGPERSLRVTQTQLTLLGPGGTIGSAALEHELLREPVASSALIAGTAPVGDVARAIVIVQSELHTNAARARLHVASLESLASGSYDVLLSVELADYVPVAHLMDVDHDGVTDLLIAAAERDVVDVWLGPLTEATLSSAPTRTWASPGMPGGQFGEAIAAAVVDSTPYLAIGAPEDAGGSGAVYVFDVSREDTTPHSVATGDEIGARFGAALATDPTSGELFVGAPQRRAGFAGNGVVDAFSLVDIDAGPSWRMRGAEAFDALGSALRVVSFGTDRWLLLGAPGASADAGTLYARSLSGG